MRRGMSGCHSVGSTFRISDAAAFTLIELMVVILVIAILVGISVPVWIHSVRALADKTRLANMKAVTAALNLYCYNTEHFPDNVDNDYSGWDGDADGDFIRDLKATGYVEHIIADPTGLHTVTPTGNYHYYKYPAGSYGANPAKGAFYVVGIRDLESCTGAHPDSPGWNPGGGGQRDWQTEFEWVAGAFEVEQGP